MHSYEVHVWLNSQCIKLTISGYTRADAYQTAKAQFPETRAISVVRQLD